MRRLAAGKRLMLIGSIAVALVACGESSPTAVSVAEAPVAATTVSETIESMRGRAMAYLTEADASGAIETPVFVHDLNVMDKVGLLLELAGDDASPLRWRFAEQPPAHLIEWFGVDGVPAFETDGLIGDPMTATKVLELRPVAVGAVAAVFELVQQDAARRTDPPAKQLTFNFEVVKGEGRVIQSKSGGKF